jgi:hypothetical protein
MYLTGAGKANFQLDRSLCLTLLEASAETGSIITTDTSSNAQQKTDRKSISDFMELLCVVFVMWLVASHARCTSAYIAAISNHELQK